MVSNVEMKTIIDTIGEPIIILDVKPGDRFIFAILNTAAERFFGISNDTYAGTEVANYEGLDPKRAEQRRESIEVYKSCVRSNAPVLNETRHLRIDGSYRWCRNTHAPIFDANGEVRQIMITSVDITELIESRNRLEDALTKTLSGFVTICSYCRAIKDDEQKWLPLETYASKHMDYHQFSHGACPTCFANQIKKEGLEA